MIPAWRKADARRGRRLQCERRIIRSAPALIVIERRRHIDVEPPHDSLATVTAHVSTEEIVPVVPHCRAAACEALVQIARMIYVEHTGIPVILERRRNVGMNLHVGPVTLVIELLLCTGAHPCKAVPASRRCPLSRDVRQHPLVVGAIQNAHVICFESGAAPVLRRLMQPVSCFPRKARVETVAVKAGASRIVIGREQSITRLVAAGSLIVSGARPLGAADCGSVTGDAGDGALEVERVLAILPAMVYVEADCVCTIAKPGNFVR